MVIGGIVGGQDEGCFGQVHLAGDSLHLHVRQAAPVHVDGKRIAAERGIGEHVNDEIAKLRH
jgi:hypothetical protein